MKFAVNAFSQDMGGESGCPQLDVIDSFPNSMAENSTTISRTQLLFGACLSLAVLIGFFLANPLRSSSMGVVAIIAGILCWPLFVRWHHPLLVFCIHSSLVLGFLPGQLPVWTAFAFGGFLLALGHRSLNRDVRLVPPGGVAWALVTLGLVVAATAAVQGGIGLKALGSASTGGKKYFYVALGIMTYFALVSRFVSRRRALLYVGLFCLSGLTGLLGHVIYMAGAKFYWLFAVVDPAPAIGQAISEWDVRGQTVFRSTGTMMAASAIVGFLVAKFGLRNLLNLKRPWPFIVLLVCIGFGALGGFRSFLVSAIILFTILFFLEGLHRTKYLPLAVVMCLSGFVLLACVSNLLPASIQRSISFLPIPIDEHVKQDARGSLDWRLDMWDQLWAEVPQHLLIGKGYAIDPGALQISDFNAAYGFGIQAEWAILAGEYHNGPLSVLIPFGLWGAIGFIVFLILATRRLRWLSQNGEEGLRSINRALFAMFITKAIFFMFFVGSLYSDLVEFAALIGLAESLNGPGDGKTEQENSSATVLDSYEEA